ncbi:MAG: hypothetical protein ABSH04_04410 [Acidimicrobiales bacterium]
MGSQLMPRCRVRHLFATLFAALPLALMLAVIIPAATPASATSVACPASGITFAATFSNGQIVLGTAAKSFGVNGTACGQLTQTSLSISGTTLTAGFNIDAPAANVSFAPGTVTLFGLISAPATTAVNTDLTGTAISTVNVLNGAATTQQTAGQSLTSTVNLLGFKCNIGPITPVLTTGTSGSLTGTTLTGTQNLSAGTAVLTGKLVANAFTVPAIQPSKTCPAILAWGSNLLLGLPMSAGKSSLTISVSLSVAGLPPL